MVGGENWRFLVGFEGPKMKHLLLLLLLQFFFRFTQGQGPGSSIPENARQYFTIPENEEGGYEVGYIDIRPQFTYTFNQDNQIGLRYFSLDSNSGRITSKYNIMIDREDPELRGLRHSTFDLLVLGKSLDASITYPIEISIEILDENDNAPVFPKAEEKLSFKETVQNTTTATGRMISTATDADSGMNGNVTDYKIISGDGPFKLVYDVDIYGDVLIIELTGKLDREMRSSYNFIISASDQGSPPLTGTTRISITIEDVNDNQPVFDPSEYYARVNETDPVNTFIIQVVAKDRDIGPNQDITYSFIETNEYTSQFRIDNTTGEIFTTVETIQCPGARCSIIVNAKDGGDHSFSGRAYVYITVDDTNNHDPIMTIKYNPANNTEFSSINETAKNDAAVAGITITDEDKGVNGQATVRIIAGNELQHFRMKTYGMYAVIFVNGDNVLDREKYPMYNLTLEARDGGSPPRSSIKSLVIKINDINEHAPEFKEKYVIKTIVESLPIGSFVASMVATDLDSGINKKLTYQIVSKIDASRDWFHLNAESGLLTTKSKLHHEIQNIIKLNISVHDGAVYALYDFAEIEIRILDENEPPVFTKSVFDISMDEGNAPGAVVVTASATDNDSGENGTVTYKLDDDLLFRYPSRFQLDQNLGTVTSAETLDREETAMYKFHILAIDGGQVPLTSTATVNLKVLDVNDNFAIFYPKIYYASVMEGEGNIVITTVTATDLDEGDHAEIRYSLVGNDFGKFAVDERLGEVKTTETLNKADRNRYTLTVMARDTFGLGDDTAVIEVTVISPTDFIPTFINAPYKFSIPEDPGDQGSNVGSNIGSVTANAVSQVEYSIVGGDPDNVFTLDKSTGWLKRSKLIDREIHPYFDLRVLATAGDLFVETSVKIIVNDVNDNAPYFDYPVEELYLLEDSPVGHYITRIMATDTDAPGPNSQLSYSLQRNPRNIFGIEPDTGYLYLNKPLKLLELGAQGLDVFEVVVMDNGNPIFSAKQELHVKVIDVNNNTPKFVHSTYEMSLKESTEINFQIRKFEAVDADAGDNGNVVYNITRGNPDKTFGIFPNGMLYVAKELDREMKDLYKISVVAQDRGIEPRSSECNITIHIADENDNQPLFLNSTYDFVVNENKPKGAFVGYVRASDEDMDRNAELSYYLDGIEMDFQIDHQTGEITTLRSFDRESLFDDGYTFTFDAVVKDNGEERLQGVATVRVNILDENDNAPVFREAIYKAYVFENAAIFSNVTVVKADDADSDINQVVTYSIVLGNEEERFKVHQTTGQITVNGILDRETEDFYQLTVRAIDSGKTVRHSATTTVQIFIKDINDNYPLFAQTSLEIKVNEDEMPGVEVAYFTADDIDLGVNGEIRYGLNGVDNNGVFEIDSHTGKIYLLKPLDFEQKQLYRMNVTATDSGSPNLSSYVAFKINIDDINDNAPVFNKTAYMFTVDEETVGSIDQVIAYDADSGKNGEVQFHIAYQDPPGDHFRIVRSSGQLYIDKQVDREIADMFELTVVATDQAVDPSKRLSSEVTVTIIVNDVNDNSPEIISFNAIKVPLNTQRNEFLTTLKATDLDVGVNGQISLQLIQNSVSKFGLESNSGRFYLSQTLSPTPVKYNLEIKASDSGIPKKSSSFDVTVLVTDNNEGPSFQRSVYSGSILENTSVGRSILNVNAVSRKSSSVEYYVTNITLADSGIEVGRYFQIDKTTGELSNALMLDRETMGENFLVEIYAIDVDGSLPRTSFIEVSH